MATVVALSILSLVVKPAGHLWAHTPPSNSVPLTDWHWRPDVILVIVLFGFVYTGGWLRLRKRSTHVAHKWRLAVYLSGLTTICLALLSPVDCLASRLFLIHMTQHELLTMVAPPLLLLVNPMPAFLWGLPQNLRRTIGYHFTRRAVFRRVLQVLTWMPISFSLYVVTLWAWHYPTAFEASLRVSLIHDFQHLSMFLTAILFWWPIINAAPRIHGQIPYGFRIVYVLVAAFQNTALGFLLAITGRVLYPTYAEVPRLWGLSPLDDQTLGGAIMSEGGLMLIIPLLVLVARMFDYEKRVAEEHEAEELNLRRTKSCP